uniref:Uncharacterized protein n=1 Tax=viral metagenome TaxID=1070528 RepID=A0A6M3LLN1_9ZZZZ
MLKRLFAKIVSKIILDRVKSIEKEDYTTKLLDGLYENAKIRFIWGAICDAGESFFRDCANEFRDARVWPKTRPR